MQIEALEIRNYRLFRDTKLTDLPRLTIVVGTNGSGKSTLFDVFSFLKEALTQNVASAVSRRGGFRELVSRGESGPISIAVKFRESGGRLATYSSRSQRMRAVRSSIGRCSSSAAARKASPGTSLTSRADTAPRSRTKQHTVKRAWRPIARSMSWTIPACSRSKDSGSSRNFGYAAEFRSLIENWHISDFHISDARPSSEAGYAEHLSTRGDNIAQSRAVPSMRTIAIASTVCFRS